MSATAAQVQALLDFMREHPDVARGQHSLEGRAKAKQLWEQLANQLNSQGGANKTLAQWKKVWADKKYLAKKANAAARRAATGNGRGRPEGEHQLTENDLIVISILGEGLDEPDDPTGMVPGSPETFDQSSRSEGLPTPPLKKEIPQPQSRLERGSNALRAPRRLRHRIRRLPQVDVPTRILRLEEEKKNVMVGILAELKEISLSLKHIANNM